MRSESKSRENSIWLSFDLIQISLGSVQISRALIQSLGDLNPNLLRTQSHSCVNFRHISWDFDPNLTRSQFKSREILVQISCNLFHISPDLSPKIKRTQYKSHLISDQISPELHPDLLRSHTHLIRFLDHLYVLCPSLMISSKSHQSLSKSWEISAKSRQISVQSREILVQILRELIQVLRNSVKISWNVFQISPDLCPSHIRTHAPLTRFLPKSCEISFKSHQISVQILWELSLNLERPLSILTRPQFKFREILVQGSCDHFQISPYLSPNLMRS